MMLRRNQKHVVLILACLPFAATSVTAAKLAKLGRRDINEPIHSLPDGRGRIRAFGMC
jgi:hypothetical protein